MSWFFVEAPCRLPNLNISIASIKELSTIKILSASCASLISVFTFTTRWLLRCSCTRIHVISAPLVISIDKCFWAWYVREFVSFSRSIFYISPHISRSPETCKVGLRLGKKKFEGCVSENCFSGDKISTNVKFCTSLKDKICAFCRWSQVSVQFEDGREQYKGEWECVNSCP